MEKKEVKTINRTCHCIHPSSFLVAELACCAKSGIQISRSYTGRKTLDCTTSVKTFKYNCEYEYGFSCIWKMLYEIFICV